MNKVQLDIRQGHAQTVDKVLKWFDEEESLQGVTVADCGCGTGERVTDYERARARTACMPPACSRAAWVLLECCRAACVYAACMQSRPLPGASPVHWGEPVR